jgi:hypothetical protein
VTVEDTEMPQLQEHAKMLTVASRISHSRQFLNDLDQLLNSIKLWAVIDNTRPILTDKEKRQEEAQLRQDVRELEEVRLPRLDTIVA